MLNHNRRALDALAQALFAQGYLDRAEIDAVLAKAPLGADAAGARSSVSADPFAARHNGSAHRLNKLQPGAGRRHHTSPAHLT